MKSLSQSIRSTTKWIWLGCGCGVLLSMIIFAPASWLAQTLASASTGHVLLQEPLGTVWSGSADLVLSGGDTSIGAVSLPSRLYWKIKPNWLGGLGLGLILEAPCCTKAPMNIDLSIKEGRLAWALKDSRLTLPAELLAGLGAPWNTLQLAGELILESDHFAGLWSASQGLGSITGQATLQANRIETALSTLKPLGNYRLMTTGTSLRLETTASDAALQLTGSGQMDGGRAHFQGEALAAPGREEALSNLLHIIGQWQPSTDGRMRSLLKLGT